jgi:alpha-D-xyloside xylohydrolase
MKFTNGAWLWRDGVTPVTPVRVIKHEHTADSLTVWGLDTHSRIEGTTLGLRFTSPMADVIRVEIWHHQPAAAGRVQFDLDRSLKAAGVVVAETPDELTFTSGDCRVRINRQSFQYAFETAAGAKITASGPGDLGLMQVHGQDNYLLQRLSLGVGECIYGLGEFFGPLVKNGQNLAIWNEDGGTCSEQAYKTVPFYLSTAGYGLLVDTPGKVDFEVGTERVTSVQMSVQDESLAYYVFYGPDLKSVLEKYTRLSGRPALPPAWSFGLWLTTSFLTDYNERTVTGFIDGMHQRGIPLKVFHFDCFWMRDRQWCDFEWDPVAFPDPVGMLQRLHAKNVKICLWINPYISALSPLFDEGRAKGYFLKTTRGGVYQFDKWQPGMAIVDFTNPAAAGWFKAKLRRLLEMGVDSFKTDFGERIHADAVYHNGADPRLMHNYYSYLYNKTVFELLEEFHGTGNAAVFARSGTAGSQKFPIHWGGDCAATFESMAEDLRGGLSFLLSGAAFWSHDIGGFMGTATPELFKRWLGLGLLSTHSRLHGSSSYRVPWLFGEEAVDVCRAFTRLKHRLMPYLFAGAVEAHERGTPLMRPMVLEFPDDPTCRYLDRQYMLGASLLVAPVFRADSTVEFYLPPGAWTDFFTGEVVQGSRWIKTTVDFLHIPLYVRAGSLVPISNDDDAPDYDYRKDVVLLVSALADGQTATARVMDQRGEHAVTYTATSQAGKLTLRAAGPAGKTTVRLLAQQRNVEWKDLTAALEI